MSDFDKRVDEEFTLEQYYLPILTPPQRQSFPVVPWFKNPIFVKKQRVMFNPRFIPANQILAYKESNVGKFVAVGYCINDEGHISANSTRTSLIEFVDLELGYFETINSHYWMK